MAGHSSTVCPRDLGDELRKLAADPDAVQIRAGPRRADAAVVGAAACRSAGRRGRVGHGGCQKHQPRRRGGRRCGLASRSVVEATPRARAALAHASASRDAAPESSPRSFTPPPPPRESPMLSPASLDIVRQGVSKIAAATVSPPRHALPPLPPPRDVARRRRRTTEGAPFDLGVESPQAHDPLRTKKPELPPRDDVDEAARRAFRAVRRRGRRRGDRRRVAARGAVAGARWRAREAAVARFVLLALRRGVLGRVRPGPGGRAVDAPHG